MSPVKYCASQHAMRPMKITAIMLAQLLQDSGLTGQPLPSGTLVGEMIHAISEESAAIVCICGLPPFALSHARAVCKRLRAVQPGLKIVVDIWKAEEKDKFNEKLSTAGADRVVLTLAEAKEEIRQLAEAAVLQLPAA